MNEIMHKYFFLFAVFALAFFGQTVAMNAQTVDTLSINVTDERKIITRDINKNLLLRLIKDKSVDHEHFGWLVEVVRKPAGKNSTNLIYTNKLGVGADQSQVYAWHVAGGEFPNERQIKVRGYPYLIKISLKDPKIEGSGPDSRFVSGTLQISWSRQK
jgi:hypothetical protein